MFSALYQEGVTGLSLFCDLTCTPILCDYAADFSAHIWTHQNILILYKNEFAEGQDMALPDRESVLQY